MQAKELHVELRQAVERRDAGGPGGVLAPPGVDARGGPVGVERRSDCHRDLRVHQGDQRSGVEHTRAERRELQGFSVGHALEGEGVLHEAGVRREHAGHVGPDLKRGGAELGGEQGGGVVAASAPQRRRAAVLGASDEAGHHRHRTPPTGHQAREPPAALGLAHPRLAEPRVGDEPFPRVHGDRLAPRASDRAAEQRGADAFPEREDEVPRGRRRLAEQRDPVEDVPQGAEGLAHVAGGGAAGGRGGGEVGESIEEAADLGTIAALGCFHRLDEVIGGLTHRRDDDGDRLVAVGDALSDGVEAIGVGERRPAVFGDAHQGAPGWSNAAPMPSWSIRKASWP